MGKRYVSVWFYHLKTDWFAIRHPEVQGRPFVLATPDHGRMVISAFNNLAHQEGADLGIAVADARALIPGLEVMDDIPGMQEKLLLRIAEWSIRFTPVTAVDPPDGILLDVSGCTHLWGGDQAYLMAIQKRFREKGYQVRAAMADTVGAAWALARFGRESLLSDPLQHRKALLSLPAAGLRIPVEITERLYKLGLKQIRDFIQMPRSVLRRRFGALFMQRLDQAMGHEEEWLVPVHPPAAYEERLPCLEPIVTATGIEIAIKRLLDQLCLRLEKEQKGLRKAIFRGYRVDGKTETVEIGTHQASRNLPHLFKLFEIKLPSIEPGWGIELFTLEARMVEDISPAQVPLWASAPGMENKRLAELLDRLSMKIDPCQIRRFLPQEHYWPERSYKPAASLDEKPVTRWNTDRPRPIQILPVPEPIDVTAPIPDYPPMLFRYKGVLHKIIRADGPERIEQEWWIEEGQHRDYYYVEDEAGCRYWLFRSGHYDSKKTYAWFIHGFFA